MIWNTDWLLHRCLAATLKWHLCLQLMFLHSFLSAPLPRVANVALGSASMPSMQGGQGALFSPRATFPFDQLSMGHMPEVGGARNNTCKLHLCVVNWTPHTLSQAPLCRPSRQARGMSRVQGHIPRRQKHSRRVWNKANQRCG